MKLVLFLVVSGLVTLLLTGGPYMGYPFRGPGYDPKRGVTATADGSVLLVITNGTIRVGAGRAFFRELNHVLAAIPESEGLIGYAVRKKVFGSEVWTLSVWNDQESLDRFLRSPAHRRAVISGGIPEEAVRIVKVKVTPRELPISWREAGELWRSQQAARHPQGGSG